MAFKRLSIHDLSCTGSILFSENCPFFLDLSHPGLVVLPLISQACFSFQAFKLAVPSAQNALPGLCTAAFISRVRSLLATQVRLILHPNRQHTCVVKV